MIKNIDIMEALYAKGWRGAEVTEWHVADIYTDMREEAGYAIRYNDNCGRNPGGQQNNKIGQERAEKVAEDYHRYYAIRKYGIEALNRQNKVRRNPVNWEAEAKRLGL